MTIKEALQTGRALLASFSDAPQVDTERLLLWVMQHPETSWLYTHPKHALSPTQEQNFIAAVEERKSGKPLAYSVGFAEFYGRRFTVTPDVLIPRPETEELVRQAIEAIKTLRAQLKRPVQVVDIGTGSGCIAVTLALECPELLKTILATDASAAALKIAKQNTTALQAEAITFMQGDLLAGINPEDIDLIISNPPYLPTSELDQPPTIETAGLKFEPRQALNGGPDGQAVINQLKKLRCPLIIEATGGVIEQFNLKL